MPNAVVLIVSKDELMPEDRNKILDKLPEGIDYTMIYEREQEDAQATANLINASHCDVVLYAEDSKLSPWEIYDHCEMINNNKKPVFVIDGKIEDVLNREFNLSPFSGTVGVVKHDQSNHSEGFKFAKAYGEASDNIPNALDTRFNIASNTKMMTSIAIAKMIE
jgi:Beta-lactamase